nr:MAG TPA: hypothetical protein [Caudoviricetes sp.]
MKSNRQVHHGIALVPRRVSLLVLPSKKKSTPKNREVFPSFHL